MRYYKCRVWHTSLPEAYFLYSTFWEYHTLIIEIRYALLHRVNSILFKYAATMLIWFYPTNSHSILFRQTSVSMARERTMHAGTYLSIMYELHRPACIFPFSHWNHLSFHLESALVSAHPLPSCVVLLACSTRFFLLLQHRRHRHTACRMSLVRVRRICTYTQERNVNARKRIFFLIKWADIWQASLPCHLSSPMAHGAIDAHDRINIGISYCY